MSALLNHNEKRIIAWKGRTFSQITASIQKNTPYDITPLTRHGFFKARPLKLYRKEIASKTIPHNNSRISTKFDEINSPNGYLVQSSCNNKGIENTLDINLTTNKYDLGAQSCNTTTQCISTAKNALRRVRSSGMIKRRFDTTRNNDTYYTSNSQYLYNRNRTFQQNQFNFLKSGDPNSTPGTLSATNNTYAAQGINHCKSSYVPTIYKPNNSEFAQQGGVSASTRLLRKKYDTITHTAGMYRTSYGAAMANSLAYGVPTADQPTTIKYKYGFPTKCTPVIDALGHQVRHTENCKPLVVRR